MLKYYGLYLTAVKHGFNGLRYFGKIANKRIVFTHGVILAVGDKVDVFGVVKQSNVFGRGA